MSYRTGNLQMAFIRDEFIVEDLANFWSEVDNNYEDEARLIIEDVYYGDSGEPQLDDHSLINEICDLMKDGHGSFSIEFDFQYRTVEGGYVVAISYIT